MPTRGMPVLYGAGGAAPAGGANAQGIQIGGTLPWGGGGGSPFAGSAAGVGAAYQQAYGQALAQNQANYNNILQGFQQTAATQARQLKTISKGYGTLSDDVLARIEGTDAAAKQDIMDRYAQQRGASTQGLINAGLGNSTVTSAVARGLSLDENKAYTNLANQMAQLSANYQSQIGLAGLGFRGNATLANSQLAQNQLQWMNSIQAQYPDPGVYAQMASMYGQQEQAERDRRAMMNAYSGMGGGGGGGGAQGLGYTPRPAPGGYSNGDVQGYPSGPSTFYNNNPLIGGTPAGTAGGGVPSVGGFNPWGGAQTYIPTFEAPVINQPGYGGGGDFGGYDEFDAWGYLPGGGTIGYYPDGGFGGGGDF